MLEGSASLRAMLISLLLALSIGGLCPSSLALASTDDSEDEGVVFDSLDATTSVDVLRRDLNPLARELFLAASVVIPTAFYVDVPGLSVAPAWRASALLLILAPKTSPPQRS